jgi:hypothetical protein
MKILLFLLILPFTMKYINSFYFTKIIYTPIPIPYLPYLHPIILFKKKENNIENIDMTKNVYIIDYTPDEIFNIKTIIKILLGQNVNGKIRLLYIERLDCNNVIEQWYNETKKSNTYKVNNIIKKINDENINNIVNKYDKSFNLYKNNCILFKKHFMKNLNSNSKIKNNL